MSPKKIAVIGSINTDMVIKTAKLPVPGETILGGHFFMNPGGKGANQAVAAARLGGIVSFIGKIGSDVFGTVSRQILESESINTNYLFIDRDNPSGVALITVDNNGENCIAVASGSNGNLLKSDIDKAKEEILSSDIIMMQLEIPIDTVKYVAEICFKANKIVMLNPAPANILPDQLLNKISVIIPNETEAEILTGIKIIDLDSAENAAKFLLRKGIPIVIVTLGSKGAIVTTLNETHYISSSKVNALDTTAAGDVFCGALAVSLSNGLEINDAIKFANKAAAISVTRMGAQASAPYKNEMNLEIII